MLVSKNIKISNILEGTFTTTLKVIIVSSVTYLINFFVLDDQLHFPTIVPSVLGTALAFFIGFNNNQAYDRWWEARIIWGGVVNDSRSFTRMVLHYIPQEGIHKLEIENLKNRLIKRHIAFLYLLKDALRDQDLRYYLNYLSANEYIDFIEGTTNKHNRLLELQARDLNYLYKNKIIDGFKFLELNKMLVNFTDLMGKSERIKGTVFPTTYRYYTYIFTWIFIVTITLVISDTAGVWSIFYASLLGYVFLTIQQLGQTLMNPFDNIPTGVSLSQICKNIERNLLEMMGEKILPETEPIVDDFYVM